jgi:hypothetical protein
MMRRVISLLWLFLLAPLASEAGVSIMGPLTHELEVEPGRSYEGTIEVHNPGKSAQEVKAYQTDYFFYADGKVLYGDPGGLPRSNARWMAVVPPQMVIPPGENATIRYSIQVPSDATLKGSYWSVIMIEPLPEGSIESIASDPAQVTVGIQQVIRYAVQVITSVGSTGSRQLRFNQIRLAADKEKRLLVVDLENSGERWLRANLWIELYDSKGSYVGKFDGGGHRLFPGTTARFTVELVGIQSSTYKAVIVADCGGDDVFGANVNLVLKE